MSQQQQPMSGIVHPHENDVLAGRGNYVNFFEGNQRFRELVRKHKVAYVACPKPQKGKFSKMIVDEVRSLNPPGRFLKQDEVTKLWYDIGDKKAMDKTRQALREGAPEIMKDLDPGEDGDEESDSPLSRKPPATLSTMPSPGMGTFAGSPQRQAPARSVSCQPQLLNGLRRDGNSNYSTPSPGSYLSPATVGLSNTIHNDSRLQPMPSLNHGNMGSHSQHSHQLPQRTPSLHLSTAGNLATMQMASLSQSLHSPAAPQQRISLSQHLSQQSPQPHQNQPLQQQLLQRQQQLLMQQQRGQAPPLNHSLPEHLPMSPQSHHVGLQQQMLQQQHLSLSQHASDSHHLMQQQQQLQHQYQPMPQHQAFHDQLSAARAGPMQAMPPLYQHGEIRNSSPGAIFSSGSGHGQYQQPQQQGGPSTGRTDAYGNPGDFARPLAPAPKAPHAPPLSLSGQPDDNSFGESERLAPLPVKSDRKPPRDKFKREGSESSLQVDTIFPSTVKTKTADGGNAADYKNHQSSSHMSVMSLSVGDMGLSDEGLGEMPSNLTSQLAAIRNEKDLSSRFNSSLRLGRGSQSSRPGGKRNSTNSEAADNSQSAYMEMSVATLGDRLSEFGDMSVARMTESQANMSFINVFEETDADLGVNEKS